MKYSHYQIEELAVGDALALDRTRLANERTFLAYIRAGVVVGVSGISILKLLPDEPMLVTLAWCMLPTSFLLGIVGLVRTVRLARSLRGLENNVAKPADSSRD